MKHLSMVLFCQLLAVPFVSAEMIGPTPVAVESPAPAVSPDQNAQSFEQNLLNIQAQKALLQDQQRMLQDQSASVLNEQNWVNGVDPATFGDIEPSRNPRFPSSVTDGTGCYWDNASGYCSNVGDPCYVLGKLGKGSCTNPAVGHCYCYVP